MSVMVHNSVPHFPSDAFWINIKMVSWSWKRSLIPSARIFWDKSKQKRFLPKDLHFNKVS